MGNIKKIQNELKARSMEALLITNGADIYYSTGFSATSSVVLIFKDKAYFLTDSRYVEAATATINDAEVLLNTPENPQNTILKRLIKENGVKKLGLQEQSLSYSRFINYEKILEIEAVFAQDLVMSLRAIKEDYEVEYIIKAQRIAEEAFQNILPKIKVGVTEKRLSAELEYEMAKLGGEGLSFDTICVSGKNSSLPHGVPSDKKIEDGDFITLDFGCKYKGYGSDMTRTVAIGSVSDEQKKVYETVLKAQLAALEGIHADCVGRDIDKIARDIISDAGFGDYFGHGLGHSLGIDVHEDPRFSVGETRKIPVGTVITVEPGIYLPEKFGVRIEDMVFISKDGIINLTKTPKELIIL